MIVAPCPSPGNSTTCSLCLRGFKQNYGFSESFKNMNLGLNILSLFLSNHPLSLFSKSLLCPLWQAIEKGLKSIYVPFIAGKVCDSTRSSAALCIGTFCASALWYLCLGCLYFHISVSLSVICLPVPLTYVAVDKYPGLVIKRKWPHQFVFATTKVWL